MSHIINFQEKLTLDQIIDHRESLLHNLSRNASILVNLGSVAECDAAGLQLLIAAQKQAAQSGGEIRLSAAGPELIGLCRSLGINPDTFFET